MLVMSRKVNEKIIIGEPPNQVEVMIVGIHGDRVRLGIEAAKHIAVDREEVRKAKLLNPRPHVAEAATDVEP
jgi:carbon storage regulator